MIVFMTHHDSRKSFQGKLLWISLPVQTLYDDLFRTIYQSPRIPEPTDILLRFPANLP